MARKKSWLAWACEFAWLAFFYSIPALVDLGKVAEYLGENWYGGDYKKMIAWTIAIFLNIGWFLPNIFYGALYFLQIPFFEKYRIHDWVWNQEPNPRRTKYMEVVKSTVVTFFINQIILTITVVATSHFVMINVTDMEEVKDYCINRAPTAFEAFWKQMAALLMFETCFYWSHRWLHSPMGYRFHKDHHAFYTPMSLAGQWGSFVDGLVSLPVPALFPVLFLDIHITTLWSYALVQTFHSSYDHCGYDFPFNPFQLIPFGSHAAEHGFHHSHNIDNFGLYFRFWDVIMGTNQHWEKYRVKRDALLEKADAGLNAEDDDYYVKDGVILVRNIAEQREIKAGTDNLEFTVKHLTHLEFDENGNVAIKGKNDASKEAKKVA